MHLWYLRLMGRVIIRQVSAAEILIRYTLHVENRLLGSLNRCVVPRCNEMECISISVGTCVESVVLRVRSIRGV